MQEGHSFPPRNPSPPGKFALELSDSPLRLPPESTGVGELHPQIVQEQEALTAVLCAGHMASHKV